MRTILKHIIQQGIIASIVLAGALIISGCSTSKQATNQQEQPDEISEVEQELSYEYLIIESMRHRALGNIEQALLYINSAIARMPEKATGHYERAKLLYHSGDLWAAIESAKKATKYDSDNRWYKRFLGQMYHENNMLFNATLLFEEEVKKHPDDYMLRYELARLYNKNGQLDQAITHLKYIADHGNKGPNIVRTLSNVYFDNNQPQESLQLMKDLIQQYPQDVENYGLIAELYHQNGQPDKAIEWANKALQIDSANGMIHISLAIILLENNNSKQAVTHLKRGLEDGRTEIAVKRSALLNHFFPYWRKQQQPQQALEVMKVMSQAHPRDEQTQLIYIESLLRNNLLSQALKRIKQVQKRKKSTYNLWEQRMAIELQLGRYDSLLNTTEEAADLFPNQPKPLFFQGLAYYFKKEYQTAIKALQNARLMVLDEKPLEKEIVMYMGESYHALRQYEQAYALFDQALKISPNDPVLLNNYSYYLAQRGQQLDKALSMIEQVYQQNPDNATFLDTYAWVLYKQGNYSLALQIIQKAVASGGKQNATILEHYGDILYKNNIQAKAVEQWEAAYSIQESAALKKKITTKTLTE